MFFFFKQKTAYELRISDWSSDVCSSDLVLILDVMLPHRTGFEILKLIKTDPRLARIPVMVLTAKGQERDRRTAENLGADAFVTKPFSNQDVVDRIKQLAAG